ncbi:unnamed protein product [Camellia sinensis]
MERMHGFQQQNQNLIKKKGKGSTTLPDIIKDRSFAVRKAIEYNEKSQPIGNNSIKCSSYHRVLARTMIPICYKDWFEVPAELKEKLWSCVELTYKVDERSKKKVLYLFKMEDIQERT